MVSRWRRNVGSVLIKHCRLSWSFKSRCSSRNKALFTNTNSRYVFYGQYSNNFIEIISYLTMVHNVWNILSLRLSAFNKYLFYYFYSWNKFHILSEVYTILSYIDLSRKIKKGQQHIGSVCVLICMRNTVMTYHWSFNLLLNGKQPIFI